MHIIEKFQVVPGSEYPFCSYKVCMSSVLGKAISVILIFSHVPYGLLHAYKIFNPIQYAIHTTVQKSQYKYRQLR